MSLPAAAPSSGLPVPPQGEIHSQTIPHLVHDLCAARATGLLTVNAGDIRKVVQIREGRVLFASSNDRDDRLNQVLLGSGAIKLSQLIHCLEIALSTRDRLGEVLLRRRLMSETDVVRWVKVQVRLIVLTLFDWTRGHYQFEAKPVAAESITLDEPGDALVLEGVRRIHSWARAYEEVGGLNTEYRTTRDMEAIVKDLPIRPEDRAILDLCDQPMSLEEICEASALNDSEVCKAVWALLIIGALMQA